MGGASQNKDPCWEHIVGVEQTPDASGVIRTHWNCTICKKLVYNKLGKAELKPKVERIRAHIEKCVNEKSSTGMSSSSTKHQNIKTWTIPALTHNQRDDYKVV